MQDGEILHLLRLILKASGKRGVPQGGVISPLLSNVFLTEVDAMLERAKAVTRNGRYTYLEYARWADDVVILVDGYRRHDRRLREEGAKLDLSLKEEKSRIVDLGRGEAFGFLGFDFRRVRSRRGVWRPLALGAKPAGKPGAGKRPAGFDVAGAGAGPSRGTALALDPTVRGTEASS